MRVSALLVVLTSTFGASQHSSSRSSTTNKVLYKFEGVDYEELPPNLHWQNNDCHAHYLNCLRDRTVLSPVCAFNKATWYFDDFYSPCEIELQNCLQRLRRGKGVFGVDPKDDAFFYNGEGFECKHYVRMGGNMMDAYFGNSTRRTHDFERIRSVPYRVRTRSLSEAKLRGEKWLQRLKLNNGL